MPLFFDDRYPWSDTYDTQFIIEPSAARQEPITPQVAAPAPYDPSPTLLLLTAWSLTFSIFALIK